MIKTLRVSYLRNNEYLQFLNDVENRCDRSGIDNKSFKSKVEELKAVNTKLDRVYNKESKSELTVMLIGSDSFRDSDLTGMRTVSEGYTYSRDKAIAEAASRIVASIDRHGKGIARMNYLAETSVINAIINDWENEQVLTESLAALNLTGWVKQLKDENKRFSDLYQQRLDDKVGKAGESFTDVRAEAVEVFKELCDTIFAYSILESNDELNKLIEVINMIIDDYNALADRRENLKEKTEQE